MISQNQPQHQAHAILLDYKNTPSSPTQAYLVFSSNIVTPPLNTFRMLACWCCHRVRAPSMAAPSLLATTKVYVKAQTGGALVLVVGSGKVGSGEWRMGNGEERRTQEAAEGGEEGFGCCGHCCWCLVCWVRVEVCLETLVFRMGVDGGLVAGLGCWFGGGCSVVETIV